MRKPTITPVIRAVSPARANSIMFPISEKKGLDSEPDDDPLPLLSELPAVTVATVVADADITVMTTTAVSVSAGVPPSVAVTVSVYDDPAAAPDKSAWKRKAREFVGAF